MEISFDEYQNFTVTTAVFPTMQSDPKIISAMYLSLGLVGEAGEVAEITKKIHRDGDYSEEKRNKLKKELGDVLWYLTMLANNEGFSLEEIAHQNMIKLSGRKERGTLGGSGDER